MYSRLIDFQVEGLDFSDCKKVAYEVMASEQERDIDGWWKSIKVTGDSIEFTLGEKVIARAIRNIAYAMITSAIDVLALIYNVFDMGNSEAQDAVTYFALGITALFLINVNYSLYKVFSAKARTRNVINNEIDKILLEKKNNELKEAKKK